MLWVRGVITSMLNRNFSWQEIAALLAFCGMILTGIKAFWFNEWRLETVEGDVRALSSIVDKNRDVLSNIQTDIRLIRQTLESQNGTQSNQGSNHKH